MYYNLQVVGRKVQIVEIFEITVVPVTYVQYL